MKPNIEFMLDEEETRLLAVFIAQLIREGVTFSIMKDKISVMVTLTEGY